MRTMVVLAGICIAWTVACSESSADYVVNGGFESGDFSNWNYTSADGFSFVDTGFAHSGSYAAFFGDRQQTGGGSISQSLATTAGATYSLSFWFAGNGDTPSGFAAIVGGNTVYQVTNPVFDANYNLYTFNFTAASTSTLLKFTEYNSQSYINLDDVSVNLLASVPEPSIMVLFGTGATTLAGYTWFRRKYAPRR